MTALSPQFSSWSMSNPMGCLSMDCHSVPPLGWPVGMSRFRCASASLARWSLFKSHIIGMPEASCFTLASGLCPLPHASELAASVAMERNLI
jgi:hypothetical protein